jgi:hypothetical protein
LDSNREPATRLGKGAAAPRRRACSAPRTPPNAGCPQRPCPLAARRSPPLEADHIPRLRAGRGRPRPTTRRATRRRTAVHLCPPARVCRATAVINAAVTSRPGQPYLNAAIFPHCAPTEPPPSIAAAGELAAPLTPAAGRPSHSLP